MTRERHLSIADAARALRAGTTTSVALTEAAFATADELDGTLGVYLARLDEQALATAQRADDELARGRDHGPLHGIPVGIKDLFDVAGTPTTAQSLVLDGAPAAAADATVVARLRAAGAVITGKTTTMEFGCGLPDPAKPFPIPRNPWAPGRWAGGSSSGSASGVAAGMFLAALGSDTAGSIRMPAAFCGVSGLLPTFGTVPTAGCVPLAGSLDRVGPLARTVADCAAVLAVISGRRIDLDGRPDLTGLRIGVLADHDTDTADPGLAGALDGALSVLGRLGADLVPVALPYRRELVTAVVVTAVSEGLAHHRTMLTARWADYVTAARGLLAKGALVSGADYVQAQRVRAAARAALADRFATVDVIAGPTATVGAPRFDELTDDAGHQDDGRLFARIRTPYWSGLGNPVLAIPMGVTGEGLPLSLQLAGPPSGEEVLLRVGTAFQDATGWHRRVPGHVAEVAR